MNDLHKKFSQYIQRKIDKLQACNNFNPSLGKKQIESAPEKKEDYALFKEFLTISKTFDLDIQVQYDASGLTKGATVSLAPPAFVYFASVTGTTIWKIGYSKTPYRRQEALQTGNHQTLHVKYCVKVASAKEAARIEKLVLRHTRKFSCDGGSEFRDLDHMIVSQIVSSIETGSIDIFNKILRKNRV